MPITPTYPGVYIEELPSGVRTIVGVSTSTTAFIGGFSRGPVDAPIRCFNPGDWERNFGGLKADDECGYAIQQFFGNGGSEAWVIRVAGDDGVSIPTAAAVTIEDGAASEALTASAGRQVGGRSVEDPGLWGNALHVEVDYDTADTSEPTLFNLIVSEVSTEGGRRVVNQFETYLGVSTDPEVAAYVVDKVNGDSKLVQLTRPADAARPAQTGTTGAVITADPTLSATSALTVDAGSGPRPITLTDLPSVGIPFSTDRAGVRRALERAIRAEGAAVGDPHLAGATVSLQTRDIDEFVLRVVAGGAGGADFDPDTILIFGDGSGSVATDLGLLTGDAIENVQQYRLGEGSAGHQSNAVLGADGAAVDADALIGNFDDKTGIYALRNVDLFNILCIPGAAALGDDNATAAVYAAAEAFCEEERSFLIVDVPPDVNDIEEVQTWLDAANIRHANAAVYFPRVHVPDPLKDNRLRSIGASGTMAGVYARTDGSRGVWKAPAGQEATLRNVQGFDTVLTDMENGVVNQVGINGLRQFPIYGRVSWGARTLVGADVMASEWKYVPVRRLALFLEESLYRGMQWVVFEPNDAPLWSQIRLNAGAFMHNLFRQGAFQGSTPADAYFVKCDAETTTQNDINLGIVNVIVGFAPLKPAEFVIIKIQQMAGQVQA
jgi:phage tail sheath protein FI